MYRKLIFGLLAGFLILAVTSFGVYKFFYPGERASSRRGNINDLLDDKFVAVGRTNIAVMGVDQREDDDGRADTIFVIMYDPKNSSVSMLSVPRDTRVRIGESTWDKINHSFNYGGPKAVISALENFLGIQIDYYVQLDFDGFINMVDAIDGVELEVEKRMYYEDPWDGPDGFIIDLQPGWQRLDGKKAIQYVRYRDEDGDIGRVQRQQNFINSVYSKMLSMDIIGNMPKLSKLAYDSVSTNMSILDLVAVGRTFHENAREGVSTYSVPGTPIYIEEINYWLPDVVAVRTEIANILNLDERETDKFMSTAVRTAYLYEDSLPANVYYDALEQEEAEEIEEEQEDKEDKEDKEDSSSSETEKQRTSSARRPQQRTKPPATEQKEAEKVASETKPNPNRQLRASIINCTGDSSSGQRMESLLERNGIYVVSIHQGEEQSGSSVVSNTQESWVVSKLAALPFRYSLRINKAETNNIEATIYVGKDFLTNN